MKAFYDSKKPMRCIEALWYSLGAIDGELIAVTFCNGVVYIECDGARINVYENPEDKTLLASFNADMSIEFLSDTIEHMIYKLNK